MFANRIRKNRKRLGRWIKRENIHGYRLYDADMPEYAVAVDVYESDKCYIHVQEYQAPKSIDPDRARERLQDALGVIRDLFGLEEGQLFLKVRKQQKGASQYEKLGAGKCFHEVIEAGHRFLVNFEDYLDTGLFLDHRITRGLVGELAPERHFLNLFAYTGSASVHAAAGGAAATLTVDMSKTYLDWARRNMELNGYSGSAHQYERADCLEWLQKALWQHRKFGLIFLDPPSFSTSSRMDGTFDVQRDHVALLKATSRLLEPDGVLIFSNNLRRFRMDCEALPELAVEDISRATLPPDFERNPKIHNCWKIQLQAQPA